MIYFALCRTAKLVKVGYSSDAESRFQGLRRMCPVDLELLGCIDGSGEMERKLHSYFFLLHARDEWFHYTGNLPSIIEQMICGTFDFSDLPPTGKRSWALARGKGWRKQMEAEKVARLFAQPSQAA